MKFDIQKVPAIQIPTKMGQNLSFLNKLHPRTHLVALLVTILGSRNKKKYSKF
jgi:hypothetical protein